MSNQTKGFKECGDCEHFLGLGDYGLSCGLDYYRAFTDPHTHACDSFKQKEGTGNE